MLLIFVFTLIQKFVTKKLVTYPSIILISQMHQCLVTFQILVSRDLISYSSRAPTSLYFHISQAAQPSVIIDRSQGRAIKMESWPVVCQGSGH